MPLTGILRSWNDDRGFGFFAPTPGGPELFVHISAFPKDGSRPTVGEPLIYELGQGKNGKPQAIKAYRRAIAARVGRQNARSAAKPRRSLISTVVSLALVVGVGSLAYTMSARQQPVNPALTPEWAPISRPKTTATELSQGYRCDGRTHCSQMTSCAEATYFLNNCPGTKMDGDNDGIPCEQQWCASPFGN